MAGLNVFQWLRYGPWLAQVVVTRRCNLKCGYCTEYDRTSDPVPYEELALRLAKLAELRAWAVCLTGGEPADVGPGDTAVFPRGWTGTWQIHETIRKVYVIF